MADLRKTESRLRASAAGLGAVALVVAVGTAACSSASGAGSNASAACEAPTPSGPQPNDVMTPLRVLRRASIALLGVPPTDDQMSKLLAAGGNDAQLSEVDTFVDSALDDPRFYQTMFETARTWLAIPAIPNIADQPEYSPKQQRCLVPCPSGTPQSGKLYYWRDDIPSSCGATTPERTVEPWWAPGSSVTLVGNAASTASTGTSSVEGTPVTVSCDGRPVGTCGCGQNAQGCWLEPAHYPGWSPFVLGNPAGQRRLASEEPARLFAHIAWHDRPVTDLILSDYSVGPTELQAAYVMEAIAGGDVSLATNDAWWRPSKYNGAAVDPQHAASDPAAWREFTISQRNSFLLADRNYTFDPRKDKGPSKGFPSAGMLTSPGFLDAFPRERVRAAAALTTLACEQFLPPDSSVKFNPYVDDPGTQGPCQNCHKRIDPAAMHFKRWGHAGEAFEGWGGTYYMPGVGDVWHWGTDWRTNQYVASDPFAEWLNWYRPGSLLTPTTPAEAVANPYALFLDFLPPEETLLNQTSDGTVGPLGFAKMIVAAGAFDACVVRQIHGRVMGRDVDPGAESGYLGALTQQFVAGGRKVRPFIKALTQSSTFRRGG